jgi:hypothetical protein
LRKANTGLIALQKGLDCPEKTIHRRQPALLGERHAFKFSNGGLEFIIGLIRAAIVGSLPFPALSQRSEPMADDDRPPEVLPRSPHVDQESQS